MEHTELKSLPLADLREAYLAYLFGTHLSKSTIQISTSDAFYVRRKSIPDESENNNLGNLPSVSPEGQG